MKEDTQRDIQALQATIARTRDAAREAGSALAERTEGVLDWRFYVGRFPWASVGLVTALGVVVGRRVARRVPPLAPSTIARPSFTGQRLAERLERMAARIVDEAADEAERRLLPIVMGGLARLFEGGVRTTGAPRASDTTR